MKRAGDSHDGSAWLSDALRDQARSHDADLERITARFERLTTEGAPASRRRRRRAMGPMRVRLLGIPLGIGAVLASATVAVAVSVGIAVTVSPHPHSHLAGPAASPKASATSAPSATAAPNSPTGGSSSALTEESGASTAPAGPGNGGSGQLAAAASVDPHSTEYWAQENLSVTPAGTIRSLRITVTVSGGSAVASTGVWTTLFTTELETTVTRVPGGLVYELTLKPGLSLGPNVYRFGFQFNRTASGHDFTLDTYSVSAVGADGETLSGSGTFGG